MKIPFVSFFPKAFLLFATIVWMMTVCLSTTHLLARSPVILASIVFLFAAWYVYRKHQIKLAFSHSKVTIVIMVLFSLTFIQGLVSAPNTTDSMVYHLPRVIYWIQEKSIFLDHKVTSHDYMPALSESLVMYFMILTGNDRLAFLPQWLAGLTVVCTSGLIATQLKLSAKSRKFALILVSTLPILLLQSASTQTDLVQTAFVVLCVYFALKKEVIPLALSVALGILTKQTFVLFAIIPLALLAPNILDLLKNQLKLCLVGVLLLILFVSPYFFSNFRLYGSLLGTQVTTDGRTLVLTNERLSPGLLASNVIRNLLIQTPLPIIGKFIDPYITNDPSTTWYGSTYSSSNVFIPQEDIASAPIHLMLILSALIFCFRAEVDWMHRKIVLTMVFSFLVFCALLKWQPYNPRLEMTLIVVAIPAVVGILAGYKKILPGLVLMSILLGFVTIIANTSHSFFSYDFIFSRVRSFAPAGVVAPQSIFVQPRDQQYFSARPYWYTPYVQIGDALQSRQISSVKLELFDEFTYPMMVLLQKKKITSDTASVIKISSKESEVLGTCYSSTITYGKICIE